MTDNHKICFITCVNDENLYEKCVDFIKRLIIPLNISVEYKSVRDASSMCEGYNKAMAGSDARYKVYLHQDAYITYSYFIHRLLKLFEDQTVGLAGVIGARSLPESFVWWESEYKYGRVIETTLGFPRELKYPTRVNNKYEEVVVVDGLLMATQYDVPWRADILKGWHFYDVSQSLEFRRAGYKIVVPMQPCSQVVHACGRNRTGYFINRDIIKAEYGVEIRSVNWTKAV